MSENLHVHESPMTGARQSMAAWSKVIESREDIPAVYRYEFDRYFHSEQQFPYVVWTPSLDRFPRKTTEKLICDTEDMLHIFERHGDQIHVSRYAYRDVCMVELGIVLLDSWLTISGKTILGEPDTTRIEFNTTSLRYFAPIQSKLRPSSAVVDKVQFAAEKDKFNELSRTNFKFMNCGRESIIAGEIVLQILYQPEIRQPRWPFLGQTLYKTLTPAHMVVITDWELILFQNVERVQESKIARYGGVWQYIPLHYIESVKLSSTGDEHLTLSIHCQPDQIIEKLFDATHQPELEKFCSQFQTMPAH